MRSTDRPVVSELMQQVVGVDFHVLTEDHRDSSDSQMMRLVVQLSEDDVEAAGFGILFTLAESSFRDARPHETADVHYQEADEWTIRDFLKHLSFAYGKLQFYADTVRGRVMKTDITLSSDGLMTIHTYHRGKSAGRWVANLQGKKTLSLQNRVYHVEKEKADTHFLYSPESLPTKEGTNSRLKTVRTHES